MQELHSSDKHAAAGSCPYPAWEVPIDVRLTVLPEHRCAYLPEKVAQSRAFWAERMDPEVYHALMDAGFRRSGKLIYQPVCRGCRQCMPIRVPVAEFKASKSQRRCARKNADLRLEIGPPAATDEKWDIYRRYQQQWHNGLGDDRSGFEEFLYESPVDTLEFVYRDELGRTLAVGICDVSRLSLSSVYFYFDPADAARGLGTFGALCELDFAANHQLPHYYLGYFVDGCPSMVYKRTYRSHEILHPDNVWHRET
jgi:arginine-tRNA-protein transferase